MRAIASWTPIGEDSIDGAAIVAQTTQSRLERADIARIGDQTCPRIKIIGEPIRMASLEICPIKRRALVEKPMLIAKSQRIRVGVVDEKG